MNPCQRRWLRQGTRRAFTYTLIASKNYKLSSTTISTSGSFFSLSREVDLQFRTGCYLAAAMLVRAVLDHVPPIFGASTFAAVANNYAGTRSFSESVLTLELV